MFDVGVEKYLISIKIYLSAHCTNYNPPFRYQNCFYLPPVHAPTQYGTSMFPERLLLIDKLHGVTNQDTKLFLAGWTMTSTPVFPYIYKLQLLSLLARVEQ
jgi:hypothetical protein